jgi:sulfur-oxidizing protein SoxY
MRITKTGMPLMALLGLGLAYSGQALAEASDQLWPALKESFFAGKTIEPADFITLEGPRRAESGAQVPITLKIDKRVGEPGAIQKLYVIVDANPIPLAAVYHFTELNGKPELATRIRMETDSYIRAIGETADGKFYMSSIVIRAAGGCGGAVGGDDTEIRAAAGKIKMGIEAPAASAAPTFASFHIKHPMFTGLQRDLASGGYKPAFYIQKVAFTYNGKPVMQADFGVAVAEDPYLRFGFDANGAGNLEVKADDNEGKSFSGSIEVKG